MTELSQLCHGHELKPDEATLNEQVLDHWRLVMESEGPESLRDSPLFVHISGPSGIGKLTVIKELVAHWAEEGVMVREPKSATTRQFRNPDDYRQYDMLRYEEGVDIGSEAAREKFYGLVRRGLVREFVTVPCQDGHNLYGTIIDTEDLSHPGITLVETTIGALHDVEHGVVVEGQTETPYELPNLISFYLLPPGGTLPEMLATIERWMTQRQGETQESIHARLWGESAVTPHELSRVCFGDYNPDYLIVNHEQANLEQLISASAIKIIVDRHLREKQRILAASEH